MKLIIVSGLSGAGKTIALHSLEDAGAYCIDNLPVNLLPGVAEQMNHLAATYPCMAVGVDARNIALQDVPALLQTLKDQAVDFLILFLEASDEVLLKRFSETRRRHPLTSQNLSLQEAIQRERHLLSALSDQADYRIDTSSTNIYQLRDQIHLSADLHLNQQMPLLFQSFGFKRGLPQDADFVFDVRCLPNPHWERHLRSLTGRDQAVIDFLDNQPEVRQMSEQVAHFLETWIPLFEADKRSYLSIAIGCTGGQHRSVYLVERLSAHFRQLRDSVLVRHRELP